MRLIVHVCLSIVAASLSFSAFPQLPTELPAGAEALAARLLTQVGPQTQAWIRAEAARERASDSLSEAAATRAVRANRSLGKLTDGDVTALAYLVLMEAEKSAREDLKAIMDGVKRIEDAKVRLRQPPQTARAAEVRPPPRATSSTRTGARPAAVEPRALPRADFDARLERAKNDLDALSEMGEMESLRLQMATDRQSRRMSTLSNLLKKISDTAQSITQNLK
ncbi:MAG TPA: hypothetical protein VKA43_12545 [Gammaproteobacteria bacterium]|nr:hypothetical protein [Gammaproteobacteria bacterium]